MPELPEVPERPDVPEERPGQGDPAQADSAQSDTVQSGPAMERASDDELFARLVADFDTPVDADSRSWPAAEDVADLAPQPRPRPMINPLPVVRAIPPVDPRAWTPEEDPDDDHFVPPPPPPLPRTETATRLAVAAVVGGVILTLVAGIGQLPGMAAFLGVGLFVGGVATLISRMRDDEEDDDDPHNGAVV
ncbi:hypothetical protein ABIA33_001713 [Streptacidiphilus sp. MAP12-16]|uniref:hypothetical protein n=1 Tax=Streptacidiphilus sp. MAP12-16 TaxID=3156300 RepID=UPI003517978C